MVVTKSDQRSKSRKKKSSSSRKGNLKIINGCFEGLEIPLRKKKVLLGRNIDCDICLDDSLVSDEHAEIIRTGNGYEINDLNSRNGVTINGTAVRNHILKDGDIIQIGNFRMRFCAK